MDGQGRHTVMLLISPDNSENNPLVCVNLVNYAVIQFFPTYFQGNNWETGCGWKSSGQHWHSNDQRNHWQFGGQIQQDPGKYTLGAIHKLCWQVFGFLDHLTPHPIFT